ncbi:microtubule-actin cross-linking factor 1-like [Ctenocephalides felis]|uniref:microtubule-actin cross-linking factor 1-like n=1 Tax=Ctenocephalides felis TaxID=7515 RepID=UPI000E6E3065|nr:microtubule-actin cross-linking factor 1-like [Ctenocephalides felis]
MAKNHRRLETYIIDHNEFVILNIGPTAKSAAKGRTNIELREQFILADGVSQTMAAFKSKPHSAQQSPGSASPVYRGSPGPITKVRERSQRSVAMGKTRKSSLSAGTPDSLSDNEGSLSNSLSYGGSRSHQDNNNTTSGIRSTTLTPGGSRGGSKPNSRPVSRAGSKPPSRHGSDLSLDSTDGTPSRIPMRRKISEHHHNT